MQKLKNIQSFFEFINEGAEQNPLVKRSCIERLSQFFRVSPNALSHFKFDGTDNIKALSKALNSTSDEGTEAYYKVAIRVGKQDAGIEESVNESEVNEGIWPKSKLASSFQFKLADELKRNFKGIFYSIGNELYHNDKKVYTVNGDKDSIDSIILKLKQIINESQVNEAEKFKSTKDFEEFLEEIDGMPEVRIKRIMGKDYIDTPGGFRDEAEDYDNDIVEYTLSNMGRKDFEALKAWWENNVQESTVNEDVEYSVNDFPIGANVSMGDEIWKVVKPGARGEKIFMAPFNTEAKRRYINIAIEFDLNWLNANITNISK